MMSRALPALVTLDYPGSVDVPPRPRVGRLIGFGLFMGAALLGGFGSWAALAPLTSAVVASGVVKVDTNRKTVQHLEGGLVREILVRDGDVVRQGQVLVRLDSLDATADRDAIRAQLDALAAQEAQLIAQRDGAAQIAFPAALLARQSDPKVAASLSGQQQIFADQRKAVADQVAIWNQRIVQYRAQIDTLNAQNAAITSQLKFMREAVADAKTLFAGGLGQKPKMLELERQVAASDGDFAANLGRIVALDGQIAEAKVQIAGVLSTQAKAVSEELRTVQTKRSDAEEQARKLEAKADRGAVLAPVDGTVVNQKVFTPGGVVAPGGPILDIVPQQDKLVFEVKIQPLDIDVVRPNLKATMRFVAYKQRTTPTVDGHVSWVAADASTDEKTGTSYFLARVEVDPEQMQRVPHVKPYPGMPVDAAVVTGERTLFDYIAQPITDSLARALRED